MTLALAPAGLFIVSPPGSAKRFFCFTQLIEIKSYSRDRASPPARVGVSFAAHFLEFETFF
jgi:hypothetical protein